MKIGKILGIEIRLNRAWGIVFVITTLLMAEVTASQFPTWGPVKQYLIGISASLLFFFSIFLHELAHSLVARINGIEVRSITLHIYGGMSRLARGTLNPKEEFCIAVVGPIASIMIGIIMIGVGKIESGASETFKFLMSQIGATNCLLGIINLLPSFPLDGGRVLRAIIWWIKRDYFKATLITAKTGQAIAGMMFVFGIYLLIAGRGISLLWIAFGLFLFSAARVGYEQAKLRKFLQSIKIGDVGYDELSQVDWDLTLSEFLSQNDFGMRDRAFYVMNQAMIQGILSLHEARYFSKIYKNIFPSPLLREIMHPIELFDRATPSTDLNSAVEKMDFAGISHLLVISDNEFQGVINRESIIKVIQQQLGWGLW